MHEEYQNDATSLYSYIDNITYVRNHQIFERIFLKMGACCFDLSKYVALEILNQ